MRKNNGVVVLMVYKAENYWEACYYTKLMSIQYYYYVMCWGWGGDILLYPDNLLFFLHINTYTPHSKKLHFTFFFRLYPITL